MRIITCFRTREDEMVTEHFKYREHFCRCGSCIDQAIHVDLYPKLEELRARFGAPVKITSGYRCPAHNKAVGGAPKSRHMIGDAADIKVKEIKPIDVARHARDIGFTGIKVYGTWVHVDLRDGEPWFDGLD